MSLISMRVTFTPHDFGGGIHDLQQLGVDCVAVGQQLVEVHRAHDGADVGHGEIDDGASQLVDLVGGLGRAQHLIEVDAVDGDHGVVAGDDVLRRNVDHLLLHVHLGADALHDGIRMCRPGLSVRV